MVAEPHQMSPWLFLQWLRCDICDKNDNRNIMKSFLNPEAVSHYCPPHKVIMVDIGVNDDFGYVDSDTNCPRFTWLR